MTKARVRWSFITLTGGLATFCKNGLGKGGNQLTYADIFAECDNSLWDVDCWSQLLKRT